jgi:lysozyme family protein
MKFLSQFNTISSGTFLFQGGIEQGKGTSESTKKGDQELSSERKNELTEVQKKRINQSTINKALEAVDLTNSGVGEVGEFPVEFSSLPSSAFLTRSPEELQLLFLCNGVVDFHGNYSARRRIGAGDLFDASQKFIKVDNIIGQRSIDSKFHDSKVGYVDKDGNYLPITGGEKIDSSISQKQEGFEKSKIDKDFSYTVDGKELTGEAAYQAQFVEEAKIAEEYEALDWTEKVQKSDEVALNTEVDLSRVFRGNEKMANTVARIMAHKADYLNIQKATGVPWMLTAAIHARESNNNFSTYLHNGEPLGKETTKVPKGIFFEKGQWKEAAIDALQSKNNFSIKSDASLGEMALFAERYNGLGYRNRGLSSPYVYSGTGNYKVGKYVADGKFDASTVDQQLGVMPIILALRGYESGEHIS